MRNTVIYIGSIMLPDKSAGAQRALSLSKSFRDLGYNVVIVGMEKGRSEDKPILETYTQCQGFDTYSVPQPSCIRQWIYHTISDKEFIKVISHYGVENIKCVVAMEYEAIALASLINYCNRNSIPVVADAEEWYDRSTMRFPMNVAKDVDTNLRMHWVYPHKTKNMICISRFFNEYYRDKVKNRVIIPGTIDKKEQKWHMSAYIGNDVLTLGYAGSPGIAFGKERLDWLVEAIANLNQNGIPCRLKIAGVDEEFVCKSMPINCRQLLDKKMLMCFGQLSHTECLHMISQCDFSVIARDKKRVTMAGFPTKLSESFGCGTPVISTKTSNIEDYVVPMKTGLLCDGFSMESIRDTIEVAARLPKETVADMHTYLNTRCSLIYSQYTGALKEFINKL